MLTGPKDLPKPAKKLPDEAQEIFFQAYNEDFGWRCSEAHAEKAAWRAVRARFELIDGDEAQWRKRA